MVWLRTRSAWLDYLNLGRLRRAPQQAGGHGGLVRSLWTAADVLERLPHLPDEVVHRIQSEWLLDGRVSQIHHLLDEVTRTQAVRIEVPDPAHRLHPGVFVDVVIVSRDGEHQIRRSCHMFEILA